MHHLLVSEDLLGTLMTLDVVKGNLKYARRVVCRYWGGIVLTSVERWWISWRKSHTRLLESRETNRVRLLSPVRGAQAECAVSEGGVGKRVLAGVPRTRVWVERQGEKTVVML